LLNVSRGALTLPPRAFLRASSGARLRSSLWRGVRGASTI
jgi:hypothetical protein